MCDDFFKYSSHFGHTQKLKWWMTEDCDGLFITLTYYSLHLCWKDVGGRGHFIPTSADTRLNGKKSRAFSTRLVLRTSITKLKFLFTFVLNDSAICHFFVVEELDAFLTLKSNMSQHNNGKYIIKECGLKRINFWLFSIEGGLIFKILKLSYYYKWTMPLKKLHWVLARFNENFQTKFCW